MAEAKVSTSLRRINGTIYILFTGAVTSLDTTQPLTDRSSLKKRVGLVIVVASLALTALSFIVPNFHSAEVRQTATSRSPQIVVHNQQVLGLETSVKKPGFPVRLKIPSLSVDAEIESVGVTSDGTMGIPTNVMNIGWFILGTSPGEKGSAVMAGHLSSEQGKAGVFSQLKKLKVGEKVYVEKSTGESLVFIVSKTSTYNPGYAEEVFNRNDGTYLNLVTCDGIWNLEIKGYTQRLVVFTELEK